MPLDRHLTPDFQQNTQVPRTVNTHTELTGGPAYPDCKPPPGRSVTDSQSLTAALLATREPHQVPENLILEFSAAISQNELWPCPVEVTWNTSNKVKFDRFRHGMPRR